MRPDLSSALLAVALVAGAPVACGEIATEEEPAAGAAAPSDPQPPSSARIIDEAIASEGRLTGDAAQDGWRRPAELLTFLGAAPGMRIIDVFAGGGYYTELLSRIVGPEGAVLAYNNAPYREYAAEELALRFEGQRLPNVTRLEVETDELTLAPHSIDAALFARSYHDLYWRPEDGSWPATSSRAVLTLLYRALVPGGVVVVQDHVAEPGSDPRESVGALHRIDPAVVRRDFEAAGFAFDGESDQQRNPGDDHRLEVFDDAIRHRTDQFTLRFRKPEAEARGD